MISMIPVFVTKTGMLQLNQALSAKTMCVEEYQSIADSMWWMTNAARVGGVTVADIRTGTVTGRMFMEAVCKGLEPSTSTEIRFVEHELILARREIGKRLTAAWEALKGGGK